MTPAQQKIVDDFRTLFYDLGPGVDGGPPGTWARTYWFGARILKNAFDLWIYQELIGTVQPELIVECGTGAGGSAFYFASLCSLIGKGEILTIDLADPVYANAHPRIVYLKGSTVDLNVAASVHSRAAGKKTLVILDSDHSYEHVSAELETYAGIVSPGSYLVVEDTNLPEVKLATTDFLRRHTEFAIDYEQEKFLMTFNTYLRRKL